MTEHSVSNKGKRGDWVHVGGAPGEIGHCTRCGEGLSVNLPQRMEVIIAVMAAFAKAHSSCVEGDYHPKPPMTPEEWAVSRDTGTSSKTIYSAITGRKIDRIGIPYDPDDFGRCYRLLKLFPAWRKELDKVAVLCPRWKPFVEAWDELTALYEAAGWHEFTPFNGSTGNPKMDNGKMYKRMNELEEAGKP